MTQNTSRKTKAGALLQSRDQHKSATAARRVKFPSVRNDLLNASSSACALRCPGGAGWFNSGHH